ncbi:MAG: hypothetical protein KGI11_00615 [Thaumarchaeota archaeon]|nr:hypothetical protein [Nitrososphaerota archaeon]
MTSAVFTVGVFVAVFAGVFVAIAGDGLCMHHHKMHNFVLALAVFADVVGNFGKHNPRIHHFEFIDPLDASAKDGMS